MKAHDLYECGSCGAQCPLYRRVSPGESMPCYCSYCGEGELEWKGEITAEEQLSVELREVINTFPAQTVKTAVYARGSGICIESEGYSDHGSEDGTIVAVEVHEGHLRLLVWSDINVEDPSFIIDLEGARKSARN